MVAYLLAPLGDLGALATPRVRRLLTASHTTFGYISVNDCHPDRSYQYDIAPFSHVYINCESDHYVINDASQHFVQQL